MLQKVARMIRVLDESAEVKPQTARGWVLLPVALAVRWATMLLLWARRLLTERPRRFPIIRPYVNPRHPARIIAKIVFPIALAIVCLVYGFLFGLTAPYLLIPFALPIVVLTLLAIWALPETHKAPTKSMEVLYAATLVSLLVWPNYLALSLPGLPWITAMRLFAFPMVFLFLISLSSSSAFRRELFEGLKATPRIWPFFVLFIFTQFATIPLSRSPADSLQAVILSQINWTAIFLIGVWVALKPGRVDKYTKLLVLTGIPMVIIALFEARVQHLLWLNHIPPFLKIDDTIAAQYMSVQTRGGIYRVKSIYASPLSFAECLALLTPLCIHVLVNRYRPIFRILCFSLIPVFFICIRMTDARLGILGMMVSFLAYFLIWALLQLKRNARSLMAAALVYAYPAAFGATIVAVLFVYRIRVLLLGNGHQASSDDARQEQIVMGIPKILVRPFGYGAGNAAETLGFAPLGFITIDNDYLAVALDYGILGFIAFYGVFVLAIAATIRTILKTPEALDTRENTLIIPLAVSATVFVVIRGVLSQDDNNSLAFAMLGLLVGLLYRVRQTGKARQDLKEAACAAQPAIPQNRRTPRARGLATRPPNIGQRS